MKYRFASLIEPLINSLIRTQTKFMKNGWRIDAFCPSLLDKTGKLFAVICSLRRENGPRERFCPVCFAGQVEIK